MTSNTPKPFTCRFIDIESKVMLELTNATDQTVKSVEILTIFLKDKETPGGGQIGRAHV